MQFPLRSAITLCYKQQTECVQVRQGRKPHCAINNRLSACKSDKAENPKYYFSRRSLNATFLKITDFFKTNKIIK